MQENQNRKTTTQWFVVGIDRKLGAIGKMERWLEDDIVVPDETGAFEVARERRYALGREHVLCMAAKHTNTQKEGGA